MKKKLGKAKKKKVFVLMVSKKIPHNGKPTNFKKKILKGEKIHTIRSNYKLWKSRIDQINKGEAILSIREWTKLPYRSPQKEIKQLTKLGYEKINIKSISNYRDVTISHNNHHTIFGETGIENIANNDGLSLSDFKQWFKKGLKNGIIIHFTNKRYNP